MLSGCLSAHAAVWLLLAFACVMRLRSQSSCVPAGGAHMCLRCCTRLEDWSCICLPADVADAACKSALWEAAGLACGTWLGLRAMP